MKLYNIIDKFSKSPTEANMLFLVSFFESNKIHNDHVAYLAEILANSGKRLKFNNDILTADIASTGGPTSLSTILGPLYFSHFNLKVPKLGVPGRPAGGVDILAQIPNYKIHFEKNEIESLLAKYNYIHFLADETFCPLDILLFNFRRKINKVNVVPLVIASLLSKKIAMDVKKVGLDIRVWPYGNFGKTMAQAKENANRFNQVANLLGIYSKCFLSDVRFPLQPYIGRGESLLALYELFENNIKNNNIDNLLLNHAFVCYSMALSLLDKSINAVFYKINLKSIFEKNLIAQGSSYKAFLNKINEIKKEKTLIIRSNQTGFLNINLNTIRTNIVIAQKHICGDVEFPDACGFRLLRNHGDYVKINEPLIVLRFKPTIEKQVPLLIQNSYSIQNFLTLNQQYEEII